MRSDRAQFTRSVSVRRIHPFSTSTAAVQERPGLPLIPRYFDLLVLLIERRPTAVSRTEIFDRVWTDVVVSDGALSQAIRTLRRTLEDDSREPIFIRTVSRHGYSFLFTDVVEESEDAPPRELAPAPSAPQQRRRPRSMRSMR